MRDFEVLFDHGEAGALPDPAYGSYGPLGFPQPPAGRPWIYSNFVQSLDGVVSFKGKDASGFHISQSPEDRWLMDLLRAHADALLLGVGTLREETALGERPRGPVYRIMDASLRELRARLGRRRETNIFVTASGDLSFADFRVFDGEHVDAVVVTTAAGAARLAAQKTHPHVRVLASGEGKTVDLARAMGLLRRDLGVRYLLCEGGPTLNGHMTEAGLIDERFLTVSPLEAGLYIPPEQERGPLEKGDAPRLRPTTLGTAGFTKETARWWTWLSCRKAGDHQFSRYRLRR